MIPGLGVGALCGGGGGKIAPSVGTPVNIGSTSGAGTTVTTSAGILAGDLVVILTSGWNAPAVTSISDGTNSYTKAVADTTNGFRVEIWYKENAAAVSSGATVTITYGSAPTNSLVHVMRVPTAKLSGALDQTAHTGGTASTNTVTTGALAQTNEVAFGIVTRNNNNSITTESAGFTNIDKQNGAAGLCMNMAYKLINGSLSAVTYAPTTSGSAGDSYGIATATFKGQ